jgi:hypothetical protein
MDYQGLQLSVVEVGEELKQQVEQLELHGLAHHPVVKQVH